MVGRAVRLPNRRLRALAVGFLASSWAGAPTAAGGVNSWTTSGPAASWVQTLAADPSGQSSVYAGAFGPVLFNLKSGSWSTVADGTGSIFANLNAVALGPNDPSTIYVGVSSNPGVISPPTGGLYKSIDAGQTWLFTEVHGGDPVYSVAVDPSNPRTVYAVAAACSCLPRGCVTGLGCSGRLFESTDSGATWTRLGTLDNVRSFVIDPIVSSTLFAIAAGGVFKSLDGGWTWVSRSPGSSGQCVGVDLAISRTNPSILFAATSGLCPAAVYKTSDGGSSWAPTPLATSQTGFPHSIAVDPTNENIVYLAANGLPFAGRGGLYRSTDGGETWAPFDDGLPDLDIGLLAVDRDGAGLHVSISQKGVFDYSYAPPLRSRVRSIPGPRILTMVPPR